MAAQRFDETRGFKFISYAVWWIRQSILQALAEQSRIVRLPLNRVGSLNKISKTFSELEQKYEREPSPEELAEVLDVTTAEVVDTMKISGRHVSMDAPFVQGEENSLLDVLENNSEETPDSGLINDSLRREVQRALSTLTQREADVITLYFGLNGEHSMTLEEIGAILARLQGVTVPAARPAACLLFASDHPVTAHGVSAYPPAVTRAMVANFAGGGAASSVMCRHQGIALQVIDVGGWDNSLFLNLPGNANDPRSPHYRDHYAPWIGGELQPMLFSRAAIDARATARTILRPPAAGDAVLK